MSGQAAARGFHFQYLVTASHLLDMVEDSIEFDTMYVEETWSPDAANDYAVDLAMSGGMQGQTLIAQIKSIENPDRGPKFSPNDVLEILLKLVRSSQSDHYELITNRKLSRPAERLSKALRNGDSQAEVDANPSLFTEWSPEERARLDACRITIVEGTVADYRRRIHARVRGIRTAHRIGTGSEASGLVVGYLVDRIFQSAAGLSRTRVTRQDAAQWLRVDPATAASVLGEYDWGNTIGAWPPLPRLSRPDYMVKIAHGLDTGRRPRIPGFFVLRGQSGIGKSSLAAEYAYENHHAYEFMAWINATDENTIRSSFSDLISAFPSNSESGDAEEVNPAAITLALSRHPGSWLLIVDNANDMHAVADWLPLVGDGDIIVTTLNGSSWNGRRSETVELLEQSESVELLSKLLGAESRDAVVLGRLAAALEHWPLALAMAAGYIAAAQTSLEQTTDTYLAGLASRAIADDSAIPEGYPRTLVRAIELAVEGLESISNGNSSENEVTSWAVGILHTAAYFAKDDIPIQLLFAAALISEESMVESGLKGPTESCDRNTVDDIIKLLRSRSLIQRRYHLIDGGHSKFLSDTISINRITQLVLRSRIERVIGTERSEDALIRAAFHVDRWLQHYIELEQYDHVHTVSPHAACITGLSFNDSLASITTSVLAGNLALAFRFQGRLDESAVALKYGLQQLRQLSAAYPQMRVDLAVTKTALQLIDVNIQRGFSISEILPIAEIGINSLEARTVDSDPDELPSLSIITQNYHAMLMTIGISSAGDVKGLLRRVDVLKSKIPQSVPAALSASIQGITSLISKGGADALAIELATGELSVEIPMLQRIELLGLRAEAFTYSMQYSRALADLETLDELAQPPLDLFPDEVLEKVNNVGIAMLDTGIAMFLAILRDAGGDALALFEHVLSTAEVRLQRAQSDHHRMHYVLRGGLAIARDDPAGAKSALRSIEGFGKPTSYGVRKDSVFEDIEPMLRQLAQDDPHPANGRSAYLSPLMSPLPSEGVESCSKKPDQRYTEDHHVERPAAERTKRFSLKTWIRPGRFRRKTS